jgi:cation transport ATPase
MAAALQAIPALSGLGASVGLGVVCGYPYVVALGIEPHPSKEPFKLVLKVLLVLFIAALFAVAVLVPIEHGYTSSIEATPEHPAWFLAALLLNVSLWGPLFLATHVLDERRRRLGHYSHLQSIPTFLGLFYGIFGGYFYVHRLIRESYGIGQPLTRMAKSNAG